ncbi:MAG: PA2169 family four-helix-bundle protein [Firmicutes bacterium]|nr:PA2169 family four-helix-bundle protein [Bacillota bacterium]
MVQAQGITPTERWFAGEQLRKEQLCLKKCSIYANQIQDPQLKGSVQRMMDSCQRHVSSLQGLVGQPGGPVM